jgi:hypothetical protein
VWGAVRGPDSNLQDGNLQLSDSALLHRKCLKAAAGLVRLSDEEKKTPAPTRATHPAGTGFWRVGKSQPYPHPRQPVPVTRTGYITRDFP